MKLTTQDGRVLELDRKYTLSTWTWHSVPERKNALSIMLEGAAVKVPCKSKIALNDFYWHRDRILDEVVGYFKTSTSRQKVRDMLKEAWKNGAAEFTVPQDNLAKTDWEQFEDFCEEHGLTLVTINELGYKPSDIPRNMRIWRETSDFERRNILVADSDADINAFGGAYSTSLAKWQALQGQSA